jgi:hypothetical protein
MFGEEDATTMTTTRRPPTRYDDAHRPTTMTMTTPRRTATR